MRYGILNLDAKGMLSKVESEVEDMGTTHVTVTVRNPAQPDKTWEGLFLVNTGAVD